MDEESTQQTPSQPGSQEWLDSVVEEVVDSDAPIIDPHHHLWPAGGSMRYELEDLLADLASGHRRPSTDGAPGFRGRVTASHDRDGLGVVVRAQGAHDADGASSRAGCSKVAGISRIWALPNGTL